MWLYLFVFQLGTTFGQEEGYQHMVYEHPKQEALIAELKADLGKEVQKIRSEHKKNIEEVYRERTENLIDQIENNHFLFNNPVNKYLDGILAHIVNSNPSLKNEKIRLFLSRYTWPNAYCIGEGTIVINVGLLRRMKNEAQLAFVICHELAHYTENHGNKRIRKQIKDLTVTINSKEFKKLKKQEYGRYTAFQNMFQGLTFDHRRHSREREYEADAVGLNYLVNTKYDPQEALSLLTLLDSIDTEKYTAPIEWRKWMGSDTYPFKSRWIKPKPKGLSAMRNEAELSPDADSLKTHPDCQKRMATLQNEVAKHLDAQKIKNRDSLSFQDFVKMADYEMVQGAMDFGRYATGLYQALKLLNIYPDDPYLRAMVGICLYEIYVATENHELHHHVPNSGIGGDKSFEEVLLFIHQIRLKELAKVYQAGTTVKIMGTLVNCPNGTRWQF